VPGLLTITKTCLAAPLCCCCCWGKALGLGWLSHQGIQLLQVVRLHKQRRLLLLLRLHWLLMAEDREQRGTRSRPCCCFAGAGYTGCCFCAMGNRHVDAIDVSKFLLDCCRCCCHSQLCCPC
jgi:hypothetical protein